MPNGGNSFPDHLRPLPRDFYGPSAKAVAPALLGHFLVRRTNEGLCGGIIVETEAYIKDDPSCHAFRGETKRNKIMWGEPGRSYVYLIYGFYFCFNTVCRPAGEAEAVLVRAIEPCAGIEFMRKQRGLTEERALTSGPGKICVALAVDRTFDGVDLCNAESPLFVSENPNIRRTRRCLGPLITTTRIGISVAADWPLRFYLGGSNCVSKKIRQRMAKPVQPPK
ncbi:MAG: 3-methyladenine glycosylase [Verrucomicrobiales bacterium]|nr:3-methyladenine glycosylase [Verrucomicrobiales bacterium]